MKPSAFDYIAASTASDAIDVLSGSTDAQLIAGGQSLVPLMNLRLARPMVLVDINRVGELGRIDVGDAAIRVGALSRHSEVQASQSVRDHAPLIAEAASLIGHVAIRNRGTFGGSVAHADPAAELPAALVALNAQILVLGTTGERTVPATEFFTGHFSTALRSAEMVVGVEVPRRTGSVGSAFEEFTPRTGDFAIVGVAATVELSDDGSCSNVRVVACGVDDRPVDLTDGCQTLIGERTIEGALARDLGAQVARLVTPPTDIRATSQDRLELIQLVTIEALRRAITRAGGAENEEVDR